ncbi:MAG: aminotransferase class V-fold PLP-dependent enzyme [Selenomonadaceae bacterium]|nr:aminotransferase class V-fold PLP-dependent enzyme [Selenomonadaceae bacterium]
MQKNFSEAQRLAPLAAAMDRYAAAEIIPWHTPGHKQGLGASVELKKLLTPMGLRQDVSLADELDNLQSPTACLQEAQELAAELYKAQAAYFMINGTTGAIHTMLMGTLSPGDKVLIPRNAHRSLFGALVLVGANPVFLPPEIDEDLGISMGLSVATVKQGIARHPDAKALVIVYPTYYGVTCDLAAIVQAAHEKNILVLVDEAHGAHLPFSPLLPPEAISLGADAAAQSTHKLLGALTQASLLLVGKGMAQENIQAAAALLQSTSPNNLLMASIDLARKQMAEEGETKWTRAVRLADGLRQEINEMPGLYAFGEEKLSVANTSGACGLDATKLTVTVKNLGLSGAQAAKILREQYKMQPELADAYSVLFIISYADGEAETARLQDALRELALNHAAPRTKKIVNLPLPTWPKAVLSPREAFFAPKESVPWEKALGRIAGEAVMFYPPGIPLLCPGDLITPDIINYIEARRAMGLTLTGETEAELRLTVIKV